MALPLPLVAHALVGKKDLPIPAWLFAWGASIALIISFAALAVAWRSPRLETDGWRPVMPRVSAILLGRAVEAIAGAIGVGLLALTVYSGLAGTHDPNFNFALSFVFVTAWLGIALLSVLLGDIFRAFNPWRATARFAGWGFRAVGAEPPAPVLPYPERLGRWPAMVGLLGFFWLELIYGGAGLSTAGLTPRVVAEAAMIYSGITFLAISMFGAEAWIARGETFSVYFNMLSGLSPLEARGRLIGLRKLLSGTVGWSAVPGSAALVIAAIAGTTFDGAQEGALKAPIAHTFDWLTNRGVGLQAAFRITDTLFLAAVLLVVAAVFWLGVLGMRSVDRDTSARQLGRDFAHSLIPIAFAYLVAHYFSLFVLQEQAQFTYLLSDPLGKGSDLFGTASAGIDYALISATTVWYVQVGALVTGHVAGLTLAHDRALAKWSDLRQATRSQYWMLAVMISFTCLGLYLLSQANQ